MSEDKSRKTEQATPKKLRESRKKGQIPRSKEIVTTTLFMALFMYFWLTWEWQFENIKELVGIPANLYQFDFDDALKYLFDLVMDKAVFSLLLPLSAIVVVVGVLGNILQFGVLFSTDPLKPRFEKINPVSGLKRIFSSKQLMETLFSLLKLIGIATVVYWVIRSNLNELVHHVSACDVNCLKLLLQFLVWKLVIALLPLLILLMIVDYFFQKAVFLKEQRMTKEELHREFKDTEGDPHIRGERRFLQREMSMDDISERVRSARVLVTDAELGAVALLYKEGETPLPFIVAMGVGGMARRMIDVARREDIAIADDQPLVDLLMEEGDIDQFIPPEAVSACGRVFRQLQN